MKRKTMMATTLYPQYMLDAADQISWALGPDRDKSERRDEWLRDAFRDGSSSDEVIYYLGEILDLRRNWRDDAVGRRWRDASVGAVLHMRASVLGWHARDAGRALKNAVEAFYYARWLARERRRPIHKKYKSGADFAVHWDAQNLFR